MFRRACERPGAQIVVLLGESTFHQVHGGVSTNSTESPWDLFAAEYRQIRGKGFARPTCPMVYYGNRVDIVIKTTPFQPEAPKKSGGLFDKLRGARAK